MIEIGPATSVISAISHSVAVSRARFAPVAGPQSVAQTAIASHVVIARSDVFADALAGTVLLGRGPMLLSDGDGLAEDVEEELRRTLGDAGLVYLLGGEAALGTGVAEELVALGYDVIRLSGPTRIETAIAIANEAEQVGALTDVALVRADGPFIDGSAWADSVTAGVWAARDRVPVLLTPTEALHPSVSAWLSERPSVSRVVVGGVAAVTEEVAGAASADRRIAGSNRFSTAVAVSDELLTTDQAGYVIANGSDPDAWAFALPATGYAADLSWPMLLVAQGVIPAETGEATCRDGVRAPARFVGDYTMISAMQRDFLESPCP